eukprot:TRINITY_DN10404_c0_g1_i11.p1 TRINITY_DN10404_c0_g1~~TRINITY_DN10404_c0_g1_i11.p1  ORF type:complete len:470 (+),score=110.87 TRINITY_DN10404_c0_g1_i11:911-2320(+)
MNPNIINTLTDITKIRRKIYVPKGTSFNYTGLIIGPRGANQKRLEEETGCKILVRGKGSQKEGQPPQPDDDEDQHVLVVGDSEAQVARACAEIERIIFADEETRNRIRQEQLKTVAQLKNDPTLIIGKGANGEVDLSLTTPYGPPTPDAYIVPVPNDCVGLVIGKGGETIKQLHIQSGARKVQVAADSAPGANTRNLFVEGDKESYDRVKRMVQEIVEQQQKLKLALHGVAPMDSSAMRIEHPVPNNLVGLIIGKGGETIKGINGRTGAFVFIPKECDPGKTERVLVISGKADQVEAAKAEIDQIVMMGHRNHMMKQAHAQGVMPYGMGMMNPYMMAMPGMMMDPNMMMQMGMMPMMDPTAMMQMQQMQGMDPNMYAAMYQQYMAMAMDPNMAAMMMGQPQTSQLVITTVNDGSTAQTNTNATAKQSANFHRMTLILSFDAVSYTHLTLPTIYSVQISVVAVSLKKKKH